MTLVFSSQILTYQILSYINSKSPYTFPGPGLALFKGLQRNTHYFCQKNMHSHTVHTCICIVNKNRVKKIGYLWVEPKTIASWYSSFHSCKPNKAQWPNFLQFPVSRHVTLVRTARDSHPPGISLLLSFRFPFQNPNTRSRRRRWTSNTMIINWRYFDLWGNKRCSCSLFAGNGLGHSGSIGF